MKLIIATSNAHKIKEISAILKPFAHIECTALADNSIRPPDEPYESFQENACHKAKYYGKKLNYITLSEDAGLCIPALNNFPGVKTKDFAEAQGSFQAAFSYLEQALKNYKNIEAQFVCAAAVYLPESDKTIVCEKQLAGRLTFPAYGKGGFGFDPIFIPNGYQQTFAELGDKVKNTISHRAKAISSVIEQAQYS